MLAFTAHFYGTGDPDIILGWSTRKIYKWYNAAVSMYNKMNAAPEKK